MHIESITETGLMGCVFTLVDIAMAANLLIMAIIRGNSTFVNKMNIESHEVRPVWLKKADAGTPKVKLAGSLECVSGIHSLQTFINIENKNMEHVKWQVAIHLVFLISSIMLAYTEKILHEKSK